ncbi:hypothetical protein Hanom_Chr00s021659g01760971 [Helianthus anomalus]
MREKPRQPSPIHAEDTLGDIYCKTYEECHANETHTLVWNLKQSDTFSEFRTCREWMMGAFPPGEVRHQKDRGHDSLYRSYVYAQTNVASTDHQIAREWRTVYLERSAWENIASSWLLKPNSSSRCRLNLKKIELSLIRRRSPRNGAFGV